MLKKGAGRLRDVFPLSTWMPAVSSARATLWGFVRCHRGAHQAVFDPLMSNGRWHSHGWKDEQRARRASAVPAVHRQDGNSTASARRFLQIRTTAPASCQGPDLNKPMLEARKIITEEACSRPPLLPPPGSANERSITVYRLGRKGASSPTIPYHRGKTDAKAS